MTDLPLQKLFDKWKNKNAVVWEYKASLGILLLKLFSTSGTTYLEITCVNTTFLSGHLQWSECNLQIDSIRVNNKHSPLSQYSIRDENAKFEVCCSEVAAVERNYAELK